MKHPITILLLSLIFGLAIAFLLPRGCGDSSKLKDKKDSTYQGWTLITEYRDTIFPTDTIIKFAKPKVIYIYDSILTVYHDTIERDNTRKLCDHQRTYTDSISDSNVTIFNTYTVTGVLNSTNTTYRLKVPLTITNTKYIASEPKFSINAGLEIGTTPNGTNGRIAPTVGLNLPKQAFSYSYEPLVNRHNVRYTRTLFTKIPKPPAK